jgi:hypothetical protein
MSAFLRCDRQSRFIEYMPLLQPALTRGCPLVPGLPEAVDWINQFTGRSRRGTA